jgi:hypothetical protein
VIVPYTTLMPSALGDQCQQLKTDTSEDSSLDVDFLLNLATKSEAGRQHILTETFTPEEAQSVVDNIQLVSQNQEHYRLYLTLPLLSGSIIIRTPYTSSGDRQSIYCTALWTSIAFDHIPCLSITVRFLVLKVP